MPHLKTIYLTTALAFSSISVVAGELDAFVTAQDGGSSCWERSYDLQHLAAHADQQVTGMSLAVSFMAYSEINPEQYVFRLETDLRDGTHGVAMGPCRADDDQMWCGVECDGGGVYVTAKTGNKVLVDLEKQGSISMSTGCGVDNSEEGFSLQSGIDDKQFLLTQLSPQFCEPAKY